MLLPPPSPLLVSPSSVSCPSPPGGNREPHQSDAARAVLAALETALSLLKKDRLCARLLGMQTDHNHHQFPFVHNSPPLGNHTPIHRKRPPPTSHQHESSVTTTHILFVRRMIVISKFRLCPDHNHRKYPFVRNPPPLGNHPSIHRKRPPTSH